MKIKSKDKMGGIRAVLIGVGVCVVFSLAAIALLAYLMGKGSVGENVAQVATKIITFISTLLGCFVCVSQIQERVLMYSGICAGIYLFILLAVNILLLNGSFAGVAWSLAAIVGGSVISGLVRSKSITGKNKRRFRFS